MPFTNRGLKLLFSYTFRATTVPTHYYVALVTSATAPSATTNTLSDLTEIGAGHGYTTGGFSLTPNSTDFSTLTEDDTNNFAAIGLKNVTWTASGGDIPASGNPARYAVLTTDEGTVANRQVIWYDALSAARTVLSGQTLTLAGMTGRLRGGSVIKSRQSGSIAIGSGSASNTATITAVDTSKYLLIHQGQSIAAGSDLLEDGLIRITLTNSTTITATRGNAGTIIATVAYEILEFF
jgi:hypothetical protein